MSPNAVGLNFYPKTPRAVAPETAAEIVTSLPNGLEPVGLFVNRTAESIHEICRQCMLRTIQLHGDEPPDVLAKLRGFCEDYRIIRAYRLGPEGLSALAEYLGRCRKLGVELSACLIDAHVKGKYGGSGRTVAWDVLRKQYDREHWPPMILAGGLHPNNVAEAIRTVRPWGVDVASGVESTPGQKEISLVERFIAAARTAFESVD